MKSSCGAAPQRPRGLDDRFFGSVDVETTFQDAEWLYVLVWLDSLEVSRSVPG